MLALVKRTSAVTPAQGGMERRATQHNISDLMGAFPACIYAYICMFCIGIVGQEI